MLVLLALTGLDGGTWMVLLQGIIDGAVGFLAGVGATIIVYHTRGYRLRLVPMRHRRQSSKGFQAG